MSSDSRLVFGLDRLQTCNPPWKPHSTIRFRRHKRTRHAAASTQTRAMLRASKAPVEHVALAMRGTSRLKRHRAPEWAFRQALSSLDNPCLPRANSRKWRLQLGENASGEASEKRRGENQSALQLLLRCGEDRPPESASPYVRSFPKGLTWRSVAERSASVMVRDQERPIPAISSR